jgi:hypothetical protein
MGKTAVSAIVMNVLAVVSVMAWAQSNELPQYIHRPILLHVGEEALDHGHFVFSEDAATPAAIAPNLGAANYVPSLFTSTAASAGAEGDVSNSSASEYEGETGAASNGTLIVSGSNHIFPGNCSTQICAVAAYASTDGTTWARTVLSKTWSGKTFGITFDPAIDYDKNGNFYYVFGGAPLSGNYPNSIAVSKSTNGTTWTAPVAVTLNTRKYFDDKYWLAVDRSSTPYANRIYVTWDRNSSNNQILYISYSTNGGTTWNAPVKVNDGTSAFERVIDAYVAVDHTTGTVYDSWLDYARNKIFVDKSTNGGANWGVDVAAATTHTGFGTDIGCVGGRSQGPAHHLQVGPSGTLYLVYADSVTGRGYDILFTKSIDQGATWSTPVTLNDDSGVAHQFHPTLSVTSNGSGGDKVAVTFYDRRDDSQNCLSHVYGTVSTDNGTIWAANVKLTTAQSDFDGNPNGPGDYSSSAFMGSSAWAFFSDHRTTNFEIYTAPIQ